MFLFRNELQHHRVPAGADQEDVLLRGHLLPPLGPVCRGQLDQVSIASCVCHHPDTFLLTTQWMKEIADNKIDSKCNEILPSLTENSDGVFFLSFQAIF